jgi:hypothetical protein
MTSNEDNSYNSIALTAVPPTGKKVNDDTVNLHRMFGALIQFYFAFYS